jgi:hypothetical protein
VDQSFAVAKAPATVTLDGLSASYDGQPKPVSATTTPEGLPVTTTYDGQSSAPSSPGSYEVVATVQDDHYHGSANATLVIEDARSALENWRYEHFQTYDDGGDAADTADSDADGLANLAEFALGLDPTMPSPSPTTLQAPGAVIEFTYPRLKAAKPEIDYIVEWSDTLAGTSWSTVGTVEISPPIADDGIRETVKTTVPGNTQRRFVRLRVTARNTQPPP